MPFFGQGQERLGKQDKLFHKDRQLVGAGAKEMAVNPYGVPQVQELKKLEALFSDYIFLHIDLNTLAAALNMGETGLAHQPNGNDAAGHTNVATIGFEIACGRLGIGVNELGGAVGPAKFPREWIKAKLLNLLELFLALLKLVAGLKLQTGNILSGVGGRV